MKTPIETTTKSFALVTALGLSVGLMGCGSTADEYSAVDKDGVVCEMEKPIGSNIMTKVCRTAQERANMQDNSRNAFFRMQNAGSTSHASNNADGE